MKNGQVQEAELKNKAGTAWSHSYLNQKPWHPLSYPNQRRKWIAEQTHTQRQRRAEDVAREFASEQEFFQQTSLLSKKEREKAEAMKGLSFMYLRPPGYNAESARAAEMADEKKKLGLTDDEPGPVFEERRVEPVQPAQPQPEKKRVKDIYGRPVPTEEEFPALKNAPRLQTGTIARAKPFGVEIRNVKCARCGSFGHQSGDRECAMKDTIMPNEEARLRRDDPLNAMMAQTNNGKWELKQQIGGMSPPRGGFKSDDANQQIVTEDDVYDEYGGFLAGDGFADTMATLSRDQLKRSKKKKHEERKHRKRKSDDSSGRHREEDDKKHRSKRREDYSSSDEDDRKQRRRRSRAEYSSSDEDEKRHSSRRRSRAEDHSEDEKKHRSRRRSKAEDYQSSDEEDDKKHRSRRSKAEDFNSSDEDDRKHRSRRRSRDGRK